VTLTEHIDDVKGLVKPADPSEPVMWVPSDRPPQLSEMALRQAGARPQDAEISHNLFVFGSLADEPQPLN
jgi:hypothetical protein